MEQNNYDGWSLFERKTLEFFKNFQIKNIKKTRLLKIIEMPSLNMTTMRRWELYEDFIIRIDWFCQEDIKKFTKNNEIFMYPIII